MRIEFFADSAEILPHSRNTVRVEAEIDAYGMSQIVDKDFLTALELSELKDVMLKAFNLKEIIEEFGVADVLDAIGKEEVAEHFEFDNEE